MNQYVISSLEQQWRKDPSEKRVFFRLAEEYRKGGVYEQAIEVCLKGIEHHPRYLPARVCLGRCRQALGEYALAEEDFKEVLAVTPDNIHALRGLASICLEGNRLDEARSHYETLSLHDPYDDSIPEKLEEIQRRLVEQDTAFDEESVSAEEEPVLSEESLEALDDVDDFEDCLVEEEEPQLFAEEDLELVSSGEVSFDDEPAVSFEEVDPRDSIDIQFDQAIEDDSVVEEFSDLETVATPGATPTDLPPMTAAEEAELTKGLKHEKMEHYEAAQNIYRSLLEQRPGDPSVGLHLNRVDQLIGSENGNRKKIRLLSNWLDKIKGVYYVS